MAKGFKTGGRRPGSKNKKTLMKERAMAASSIDPMSFFLGVMRSDVADPKLRLEAGKAAATYLYKKPTDNTPPASTTLRPVIIEGIVVLDWSERDEQRWRYLRSMSYVPGLNAAETQELAALGCRKHAVEIEHDLATKTPEEVEAMDREGAEIFRTTVEEIRSDREAILRRAREYKSPTK